MTLRGFGSTLRGGTLNITKLRANAGKVRRAFRDSLAIQEKLPSIQYLTLFQSMPDQCPRQLEVTMMSRITRK